MRKIVRGVEKTNMGRTSINMVLRQVTTIKGRSLSKILGTITIKEDHNNSIRANNSIKISKVGRDSRASRALEDSRVNRPNEGIMAEMVI